MSTIRTPKDALSAIFQIARWDDKPVPSLQELTNLVTGMELALQYPEWTLALLTLTGRERVHALRSTKVKAIVEAHPIETEVRQP